MSIKATRRRMISCCAQIINDYVLGYKIPELVKHEKIKARKLSYDSQVYLLMLGQFLHVFSLNELVDISKIYAKELSRIRGFSPANLNTFSYANRTRNPSVMEKFFWMMYDHFKSQDETFIKAKHKGKLSRFKLRNIYAIDSTTIKLAYWCIKWAKHRQRNAARPRADMGCAFDASSYAIYQVQVSGSVQLFALRRIYPSRHVAEKGSYAEPLVLWDSTSPGKRSPTRKCTIFTGV